MLDKFDYKEPSCPLCGGREFYYPDKDAPLGFIPTDRIIRKVDSCFDKNDYEEAGRLLNYWRDEAVKLRDKGGELAMESELIGYYRKQNDRENGLFSVAKALALTDELNQGDMASGATVFINCATAYKAFGMSEDAIPLYILAENIYKNVLPEGDCRFGGLYNNMALALVDLNEFEKAEASYFSALAVMGSIAGGEAESAVTYVNMAHMYEKQGKREKISECMKNARELLESDSLEHNGAYAFVLEKCAPSFGYFGEAELCEKMKREALRIYERS